MLISLVILLAGLVAVGVTRHHRRSRDTVKWVFRTLTVVGWVLWLASLRYAFGYLGQTVSVYFESGGFAVFASRGTLPATGWTGVGFSRFPIIWSFGCPAMIGLTAGWIPVVAAAVPLALACRMWKPPKRHCAKCDYDLTGNVSGICPECGRAIDANAGKELSGQG